LEKETANQQQQGLDVVPLQVVVVVVVVAVLLQLLLLLLQILLPQLKKR
jgi:hypothetical protein